jgi:hypothetical protein
VHSFRLAAAGDKVYQLLAHGRWFSVGTQASSTTKTGRHYNAVILLKVALNTNQSKNRSDFGEKKLNVKHTSRRWRRLQSDDIS